MLRRARYFSYSLLLGLLLLLLWGLVNMPTTQAQGDDYTATPEGNYILQNDVYLRGGPGRDYPPVGQLTGGFQVEPVARNLDSSWILIRYWSGGFGWIRGDLVFWVTELEPLPILLEDNLTPTPDPDNLTATPFFPTETPTGHWANLGPEGAYVRAGPGRGYLVVGFITTGDQIEPVSRYAEPESGDTSWVMIRFGDGFGWVQWNLVRWAEDLTPLPLVSTASTEQPDALTPTVTFTPSATLTGTATATFTATSTGTLTPTNTVTITPTPTLTFTPTSSLTATPSLTPTLTHIPATTVAPSHTPTETATLTPTQTATETATNTPTLTLTATLTATFSPTPSSTPSSTATATKTATLTPSATFTETATPTALPSETPTLEDTPTETRTPTTSSAVALAPLTFTPLPVPELLGTPDMTATTTQVPESTQTPDMPPSETATQTEVPPTTTPTEAQPTAIAVIPADEGSSGNDETPPGETAPDVPSETIAIGIFGGLAALYLLLYLAGAANVARYRNGFVLDVCPVCEKGELHLDERRYRVLGIPRLRRTVRCDYCGSGLRQVGRFKWRYTVDGEENPKLHRRYNGRVITDAELAAFTTASRLRQKARGASTATYEAPQYIEEDDSGG